MEISRIDPAHETWADLVAHLRRVDHAQWVLDEKDEPTGTFLFLAAVAEGEVVGDLTLEPRNIVLPATEWSGGKKTTLLDAARQPVRETYVMTFCVEEPHRRRGIGRALQEAALAWTKEVGCMQMRSWSSLDKPVNYALKLSMGFAMDPAVHDAAGGIQVTGVYFVKRVDGPG